MNIRFTHIARLACVALAAAAHAAPVPIVNHSFEDPVLADGAFVQQMPGWSRTNTFCGVFNPTTAAYPAQAPDGQNIAFLDNQSSIFGLTSAFLQPNTTYTLTVDYGSQLSFEGIAPYIAIAPGGNVIAACSAPSPAPPGQFATLTCTVSIGDDHPHLGKIIFVTLAANAVGVQVNFDNVRLDATPSSVISSCVSPRQLIRSPSPADTGFSNGIAVDGDTAVVYSSQERILHFYSRVGGMWSLVQSIQIPMDAIVETPALALEGDTLVFGADRQSTAVTASGAAHIYQRSGGVWAYDEQLLDSTPAFFAKFGASCDIEGDRIIIGALGANDNQGHATVFRKSGNTWVVEQVLTTTLQTSANYGVAVALDGEFAFVGSRVNRVAVYKRAGTLWTEQAPLIGPNASSFGSSLDADGGALIIGAPEETLPFVPGEIWQGAAYLYRLFNGQWILEQRLIDNDPMADERFGWIVRLSQGRAAVLSPSERDFYLSYGSVSVFQRGLFNWSLLKKVDRVSPNSLDQFYALAFSGNTMLMTDVVNDSFVAGPLPRVVTSIEVNASTLTQQPQNQVVPAGGAASLSVQSSSPNVSFQWRKEGVALSNGAGISGATSSTLTINPVNESHTGIYDCLVSSSVGCQSILSNTALIGVGGAPAPCPGDADANLLVDFRDIVSTLRNWGVACP